ncbi:MAG: MBL fold metallo-hydrolase, partial [Nanoarchaeota archaeon]|nr:MBL fold metallo-hydrolase [Nanoarchaeota archaeon]
MIKITFLGTASAIPTPERNHPAILLSYKNENILVDCGEGTQRQFYKAKIFPTKITRLLITHWHGDHVLGIPGLLQTLAFSHYSKELQIYGPKGTKYFIAHILKSFKFMYNIKIKIHEINGGKIIDEKDFCVYAHKLKHTNTLGYRFEEKTKRKILLSKLKKYGLKQHPILKKLQEGNDIIYEGKKIKADNVTKKILGKSVAFIFDTGYCSNALKLAENASVVISEATFLTDLEARASEVDHLTAK